MEGIIDNINKTLKSDIITELRSGSKVAISASYFSIYAFKELKNKLEDIEELRFIFTSPTFVKEKANREKREFYIPRMNREQNLYGSEFEVKLRNELSQKAIAKEFADWIRQKACFKSNKTGGTMQGFVSVDDKIYTPINAFTTVELGCEKGDNIFSLINKFGAPSSQQYLSMFDQVWNDNTKMEEVTDKVLDNITNIYKENSPDFLYFVTIYNIFKEFLDDISEDDLPNEATGFKDSQVWNKLYNFQKDACLAIINKLEKYNGCILADSVGLGKTFTALSVIKYYENRNKSVLVLCPKKLSDNWMTYKSNYKNNPISKDRMRYDVLFHSDLSRTKGETNGLDLSRLNWGNYDLVVIDESHNFRNGGKITTDENDTDQNENRYVKLMKQVIRAGVKTKVLMLSATPVNNGFNDLKNQIQLSYEGDSEKINKQLNTSSSIEDIFRQAQAEYNKWSKLPVESRTTKELLNRLSFDFFEVLDSVTIARSRKHIEQYYNTADIGKFPTRLEPISRRPDLTDLDSATNYSEIYEIIDQLNLAIYTPSNFILHSKREKYVNDKEYFAGRGMTGREMGIRRLMGINMLKRLESSVNSLRLTIKRIQELILLTINKLDTIKASGNIELDLEDFSQNLDYDDNEIGMFIGSEKTKIALQDIDDISWREYLNKDLEKLNLLLSKLEDITPEHDSKLQQLKAELYHKFDNPINGNNKKVIIFTAFSDTAEYLYDCLADSIKREKGLNTVLITGSVEARSTLKLPQREKLDFNKALTLFSPISKEKSSIYSNISEEIDILIATDCISEGQNLQDCDYLINYDIHWNPVRIVQRFGRIDRIGSQNNVIQLVNYWPNITLDNYINLKGRVESRMKIAILAGAGTGNPISTEEQSDLDYRHEQLKRLQNEVVDIEEMNTGISIMDLGLNEFRLDLLAFLKENPNFENTPFGLHAVIPAREDNPPGVIYVLKNRNNGVNIDHKNRLHPFYMVYISEDKEVIINHLSPKELLNRIRFLCKGKTSPDMEICKVFNELTQDGKNMKQYSELLGEAITSIVNVKEESDIDAFLSDTQGSIFSKDILGLDDFELICFLVIK